MVVLLIGFTHIGVVVDSDIEILEILVADIFNFIIDDDEILGVVVGPGMGDLGYSQPQRHMYAVKVVVGYKRLIGQGIGIDCPEILFGDRQWIVNVVAKTVTRPFDKRLFPHGGVIFTTGEHLPAAVVPAFIAVRYPWCFTAIIVDDQGADPECTLVEVLHIGAGRVFQLGCPDTGQAGIVHSSRVGSGLITKDTLIGNIQPHVGLAMYPVVRIRGTEVGAAISPLAAHAAIGSQAAAGTGQQTDSRYGND